VYFFTLWSRVLPEKLVSTLHSMNDSASMTKQRKAYLGNRDKSCPNYDPGTTFLACLACCSHSAVRASSLLFKLSLIHSHHLYPHDGGSTFSKTGTFFTTTWCQNLI
jgi:hypothetical protein